MTAQPDPTNERVLDAAFALLEHRRHALARIEAGDPQVAARLVAVREDLARWMLQDSLTWRQVLSTRVATSSADLRRSMPNNRRLVGRGVRMSSVFDEAGTEPAARALLAAEHDPVYYYGRCPMRMRVVDLDHVYVAGRYSESSILRLAHPAAVRAALRYSQAVMSEARPCRPAPEPTGELTTRQRAVVELLVTGLRDEDVGRALGVSVRTVRMDVATVMTRYGVRNRVGLGHIHAQRSGGLAGR